MSVASQKKHLSYCLCKERRSPKLLGEPHRVQENKMKEMEKIKSLNREWLLPVI